MNLEVKNVTHTINTTDLVVIRDEEKNTSWNICVEKLNGKIIDVRESVNPSFLNNLPYSYRIKLFNLAIEKSNE